MPGRATPQPLEQLRFNRILAAIDDSDHSDLVLAAAATAARHNNSRLTLISVAPKVPTAAMWRAAINPEQLQSEADAATEGLLREAAARLPDDVPVTTLFRRGKAGPEIIAEIRRGDYDAVLMGARGSNRVQALIGSVSQYVLRNANIAVVVVHAPPSESRGGC